MYLMYGVGFFTDEPSLSKARSPNTSGLFSANCYDASLKYVSANTILDVFTYNLIAILYIRNIDTAKY